MSSHAADKLRGRYTTTPRDLFRVNGTDKVILRDYKSQTGRGRNSYDLHLNEENLVVPAPDDGHFHGPNGASLRPNTRAMQEIIRNFKGRNVTVYRIPQGIDLESWDLILLWEFADHWSMQTNVPITLRDLNKKLTQFCIQHAEKMSVSEFCEQYPYESAVAMD